MSRSKNIYEVGRQSVWYDNISRQIIESGELKRLIEDYGVRGLTSNPTIFDNAISKTSAYDALIADSKGQSVDAIYENIAISDVGAAADLLRPIYDASDTEDGYASIEVSPLLAADTEGTIAEGIRLFEKLKRPNIMIKVPGTREGIPAVKALLERGINVNITLLFSVENYVEVARTYVSALTERMNRGEDVRGVRSVASFFVSRVDTVVDGRLNEIINSAADHAQVEEATALLGRFGVANSRLAYQRFQEIFSSEQFAKLRERGAFVQRPLWASTGVKNPAYRDVLYVEELIGPDTVNTMPHDTLMAFADHGVVENRLASGLDEARAVAQRLKGLGIPLDELLQELQIDGVKKFSDSFTSLNETIRKKLS
jgi:transaldolase